MFSHRSVLAVFSCLLCAFLCCHAQEVERVKVRFVSFPKLQDAQPVELLVGESETLAVELPTNSISDAYTVVKPARWVLGKTVTDAAGKKSFKSYGEAPVLAAKEQMILAVRKGKTDADGFKLIPFDVAAQGFGGGKYLFFNASKVDIGCTAGDMKFSIKPLQHSLVAPKPNEVMDNDRKLLFIHLFFRKGNDAKPFYSSQWRFNEKARSMVFLFHEGESDHLRLHTIREFVK